MAYYGLMSALKSKDTSPLLMSVFHFLPTLLLLALVVIGLSTLTFSREHRTVLGVQTTQSQVRTLTVEDRIKELKQATQSMKSEAADKQVEELSE